MQRCVYAIPSSTSFPKDAILKLESDVKESQISAAAFHSHLHVITSNDMFFLVCSVSCTSCQLYLFLLLGDGFRTENRIDETVGGTQCLKF